MGDRWSRRDVVRTGVAAGVGILGAKEGSASPTVLRRAGVRPVVVASANGLDACRLAMERILAGDDTLDAVVAGVNLVEEDPGDTSVGYGGLPNEEGVVQLDASVMHGPTRSGGAVAGIEGFVYPSRVAKTVMERTSHVLLAGEGAARFARAHGFEERDLLTDRAREIWLRWRESHSDRDDWLSPRQEEAVAAAGFGAFVREHGTINCNAVDGDGNISGVTTTSGMAFKIPGRIGDSPILGAGLYIDNDVGACGSTGRGEANLLECSSFLVVESLRRGEHPKDAAIAALRRIASKTVAPHVREDDGRPNFNVRFYCLDKSGRYAAASMWGEIGEETATFAVNDGGESRLEDCAALYEVAS